MGSRRSAACGKEVTYQLAYGLAKRGVVVVSSLALGIGSIAQRVVLDAGGITVAILANSVDIIHPANHKDLAKNILANNGAIIDTEATSHSETLSTIMHDLAHKITKYSLSRTISPVRYHLAEIT